MKDIVIMLVKLFLILGDIQLLLVLSTFRLWDTGECNKFRRYTDEFFLVLLIMMG